MKIRVTIEMGYQKANFDFADAHEAVEFAYLASTSASTDNRDDIEVSIKSIKDGEENA